MDDLDSTYNFSSGSHCNLFQLMKNEQRSLIISSGDGSIFEWLAPGNHLLHLFVKSGALPGA